MTTNTKCAAVGGERKKREKVKEQRKKGRNKEIQAFCILTRIVAPGGGVKVRVATATNFIH